MALDKIKEDRQKKLVQLKADGVDAYPGKLTWARQSAAAVLADFDKLVQNGQEAVLAGRLKLIRLHGGSAFAKLEDASGQIQVYFKKDEMGETSYVLFVDSFDMGDFIEVRGTCFVTQKGEKTLLVKEFKMLAKSQNQLPDKWHGLNDTEERFRRRYLDLLMNPEVRQRFIDRSRIIKNLRDFFDSRGFSEVETPILQTLPGGALAKPFKTHLNALDMDLYLRVAPELYLKRLIVGGLEKVYELGRCFRNEGMDKSHNPDFTMLEFYWAYADYEELMRITEELFEFLAPETVIEYQGQKIDFTPPFKRVSMRDLILQHYLIDIKTVNEETLRGVLAKASGEKIDPKVPQCKLIDELFKTLRPQIIQPTFILNHPLVMSPLAKASSEEPTEAARFQLIVGGMEMVNAYSELNDPQEQASRMEGQEKHRDKDEIQRFDQDYIEALEYGMPPTAGWGMGIDRLVMLLTNAPSLREVILFPAMREK